MKGLLLVTSFFLSANVFAIDVNSTWAEINASFKTNVKAPQIAFAAGQATSFYTVFETCVLGDKILTAEPKDIFEHVNNSHGDIVVVGQEVLSQNRTYKMTIPMGDHDGRTEVITVTIPLTYQIDVHASTYGDHNEGRKLFTKSFTIPACN